MRDNAAALLDKIKLQMKPAYKALLEEKRALAIDLEDFARKLTITKQKAKVVNLKMEMMATATAEEEPEEAKGGEDDEVEEDEVEDDEEEEEDDK